MELPFALDLLLSALVILGAVFSFIGSLGLAKLSQFVMRLHGPTKASTLGVGCVLIASAGYFGWTDTAGPQELMITLFLFLLGSAAQAGDIYRWTDAQGRTHYGDQPPANGAEKIVEPPPPSALAGSPVNVEVSVPRLPWKSPAALSSALFRPSL